MDLKFIKNEIICETCKIGFYLTKNYCLERSQVENCETYKYNYNSCLICKEGFVVSVVIENNSSSPKCLKMIENC